MKVVLPHAKNREVMPVEHLKDIDMPWHGLTPKAKPVGSQPFRLGTQTAKLLKRCMGHSPTGFTILSEIRDWKGAPTRCHLEATFV